MEFNLAQKRVINSRPNGYKVIKGNTGCGKTTAVMNRITKLLDSYCVKKDDEILVASKNEEGIEKLLTIYEDIVKSSCIQKSFFDEEKKNKLVLNDINSLILFYFHKYKIEHNADYNIASHEECEVLLSEAVEKIADSKNTRYTKVKFLNDEYVEFFKNEIKWIKECRFIKEEDYYTADRSSRVNSMYGSDNNFIKLRKNCVGRKAVFEVMNEYNKLLKAENLVDFQDAVYFAAKECGKKSIKKFTHVIVDEAQRFTRLELELLDNLYNKRTYSSMTFVLDTDKMADCEGYLNKKRKFSSLGYDVKGKSTNFKENFNHREEELSSSLESRVIDDLQKSHMNSYCDTNPHKTKKIRSRRNSKSKNCNDYAYDLLSFKNSGDDKMNNENSINKLSISNKADENMSQQFEVETTKFIDLNRNVCHEFITDSYENGEIYVSDDNFKEKVEDIVSIPVFNEIAAGSPILMNDEVEYSCSLPKEWLRSTKDLFILKIKGDSMVGKNINDGDHVLINKQKYPRVNDVVAVEIEGEATLKTFKTKGRSIILKPENNMYDPIILNGEQEYSILGVAVGILKNFD